MEAIKLSSPSNLRRDGTLSGWHFVPGRVQTEQIGFVQSLRLSEMKLDPRVVKAIRGSPARADRHNWTKMGRAAPSKCRLLPCDVSSFCEVLRNCAVPRRDHYLFSHVSAATTVQIINTDGMLSPRRVQDV